MGLTLLKEGLTGAAKQQSCVVLGAPTLPCGRSWHTSRDNSSDVGDGNTFHSSKTLCFSKLFLVRFLMFVFYNSSMGLKTQCCYLRLLYK